MAKKPKDKAEDPNLAGFRALLARKKAAKGSGGTPAPERGAKPNQPPRPKERMRRRP